MALASGSQIYALAGDTATAVSLTADLTDGSVGGGSAEWANTDLAPLALAALYLPNGCTGGAWDASPAVYLWGSKLDIDGTSDETPQPSASDTVAAHYLGTFALDNHATPGTAQRREITFATGGRGWKLWIENDTGRSLDYVSTAMTVKVQGASVKSKA